MLQNLSKFCQAQKPIACILGESKGLMNKEWAF